MAIMMVNLLDSNITIQMIFIIKCLYLIKINYLMNKTNKHKNYLKCKISLLMQLIVL
jgi:hypothetical protein